LEKNNAGAFWRPRCFQAQTRQKWNYLADKPALTKTGRDDNLLVVNSESCLNLSTRFKMHYDQEFLIPCGFR